MLGVFLPKSLNTSYYYTYDKVLMFNKSENGSKNVVGGWWVVGGGMTSANRTKSTLSI